MELNKQNQLVIVETDIIHEERYSCPSCYSETYSSMYMEKFATKSRAWIISDNSFGPSKVMFCKCKCGHIWAETFTVTHHRPLIREWFMVNFKPYRRN